VTRPIGHYSIALLQRALVAAGGNQQQAAAALGLSGANLRKKLWQHYGRFPTERWDDEPLAWVIRYDGDRMAVAPVWTRAEADVEAESLDVVAFVTDEGDARRLVRRMNTTLATRHVLATGA